MPDDDLVEVPLNAPKFKANVWFGHRRLFDKIGFKAILHWQESYEWTGALVKGPVLSFTTIDAQVSYQLPFYNSVIKIGATNLFDHKYTDIYGGSNIGAIYYVSILVDELFADGFDFDLF